MKIDSLFDRYRVLFYCVLGGLFVFTTRVADPIPDTLALYHEGEYVGYLWHMRAYYRGLAEFPLFIHGAMDYLPSIIASFIYGDLHVLGGTRVINALIVWLSWIMLFDVCDACARKTGLRVFWAFVVGVIFVSVSPSVLSFPMQTSEAFVGTRDLWIMATIWCFTRIIFSTTEKYNYLLTVLGSVSAAIAFFWSYDRGIMAFAFLGCMTLWWLSERKHALAAITVLCSYGGVLVIGYLNFAGPVADNIQNILHWARHSKEIWGVSYVGPCYSNITALSAVVFCGLIVVTAWLGRSYVARNRREVFYLLGLFCIQALLMKSSLNRPGGHRVVAALWPSIIVMIYLGGRFLPATLFSVKVDAEAYKDLVNNLPSKLAYALSAAVFSLTVLMVLGVLNLKQFMAYGSFAKSLVHPKENAALVSEDMNKVGALLREDDAGFFSWSNDGILALLAKKRFCTRYSHTIYAARSNEEDLLQGLKKEDPKMIVFDPTAWGMTIDGRTTANRLPEVNEYINAAYPRKEQVGRYIILRK